MVSENWFHVYGCILIGPTSMLESGENIRENRQSNEIEFLLFLFSPNYLKGEKKTLMRALVFVYFWDAFSYEFQERVTSGRWYRIEIQLNRMQKLKHFEFYCLTEQRAELGRKLLFS